MRQMMRSAFVILASVVLSTTLFGHPGHQDDSEQADQESPFARHRRMKEVRLSETSAPTSLVSMGRFVVAKDRKIQIRREDDSLLSIPMEELKQADRDWIEWRMEQIREQTEGKLMLAQRDAAGSSLNSEGNKAPVIAADFDPFVKLKAISTRWDDRYFYIESNGIPDHQMMVGIRSWQQQVPIPQKYTGENAWQVPLDPVPAKRPMMTKNRFLRGAIAIAVNGVPIFNPLNNRGEDAYKFGELDDFGGHCGRADDYHYHLAPVHLQKVVGQGKPIAYALDGYPIYGYEEPDGSQVRGLDALNGHKDAEGNYHYHATREYPYLNGGFFGEVVERGGQVDPQPRSEPLRPALPPLRGATITDFKESKPGSFVLIFEVNGAQGSVSYSLNMDGSASFQFVDPRGNEWEETYSPPRRGPGGRRPPPPPPGGRRPPLPRDE